MPVASEGLALPAFALVPETPARGVVVLLHGIPSAAPPDPDDPGYEGFAQELASRGWIAVWGSLRAAKGAPGTFSIEGWVRDATALIATAGELDPALPVTVVGSSAGGAVAAAAVARGAGVAGLVTLGTPAAWDAFAPDGAAGIRRIVTDAGMEVSDEARADPEGWAREFDEVTAETIIPRLSIPVWVVHGSADEVVPVEHAHRLGAAGNAEVTIVPGGPHQLRRLPGIAERIDEKMRAMLI